MFRSFLVLSTIFFLAGCGTSTADSSSSTQSSTKSTNQHHDGNDSSRGSTAQNDSSGQQAHDKISLAAHTITADYLTKVSVRIHATNTISSHAPKYELIDAPDGWEINATTGDLSGYLLDKSTDEIKVRAYYGDESNETAFPVNIITPAIDELKGNIIKAFREANVTKVAQAYKRYILPELISRFPAEHSPVEAIKMVIDHPEMRGALASVDSAKDTAFFALANLDDFIKVFKKSGIDADKYRNILFGYAVQANSAGIRGRSPWWDGWGGHLGMYGYHRTYSKAESEHYRKVWDSFKQNGVFPDNSGIGWKNQKDFIFYVAERVKVPFTTLERNNAAGFWRHNWDYNKMRSLIGQGVDFETEDLGTLLAKYQVSLPTINAWLKMMGKKPRSYNDVRALVDRFIAKRDELNSYIDLISHYGKYAKELNKEVLGDTQNSPATYEYLEYVTGLATQGQFSYSSAYYSAKRAIELSQLGPKYETDGTRYFPLLDDNMTQRPWVLYALDSGTDQEGCDQYAKRFFEDNPGTRKQMWEEMVTEVHQSYNENYKTQRLHTNARYQKVWDKHPEIYYAKHNGGSDWSINTIMQQGGICSAEGTIEQFTRSCLGQPTVGRHEPEHRSLVVFDINTKENFNINHASDPAIASKPFTIGAYHADLNQDYLPSIGLGTTLVEPWISDTIHGLYGEDKDVAIQTRRLGWERLESIVEQTKEGNNGFDTLEFENSRILTRAIEMNDFSKDEIVEALKANVAKYPKDINSWYLLAQIAAHSDIPGTVAKIDSDYVAVSKKFRFFHDNDTRMVENVKTMVRWGILSTLLQSKENVQSNIKDLLQWQKKNFPTQFNSIAFYQMFKAAKKNLSGEEFKDTSREIFMHLVDNNRIIWVGGTSWVFPGNAKSYWGNDEETISQMREYVINAQISTSNRNKLLGLFGVKQTMVLSELAHKYETALSNPKSNAEKTRLYLTIDNKVGELDETDYGKHIQNDFNMTVTDGSKEFEMTVSGVKYDANGTIYAINDVSVETPGVEVKFAFWIDSAKNTHIPNGTYSSTGNKGVFVDIKGLSDETSYNNGAFVLKIDNLHIDHQ